MRGSGVCPFLFVSFIPSVDQELRAGLLTFICLGRVRVVVAPRGRMLPLGGCSGISRLSTVWPLPVLLRAGRERAVPCWGWCGFRAWWRRGVGDDGMPRDCARCECGHGVSLCLRVVLFAGGCAPCLVHGVWLRVLFRVGCFTALVAVCPLRLFVCRLCPVASLVACLLCFGLFDGYCMFVRFVSAPARGVTWFMTVCAGARLTATAVVVYCLLCKGRFWQFAEHFLCAWCSR